jgi:hypothetical protein
MKLRLNHDTIRFRFTRGEVETLHSGIPIEDSTPVGPGNTQRFAYRVVPASDTGGEPLRAELLENVLTVSISQSAVAQWRDSDKPGVESQQSWPGGQVRILLEKDLQRLNPKPDEEPVDVFPNPQFGKARCDHP